MTLALSRHSRESGNPASCPFHAGREALDSRFRGTDDKSASFDNGRLLSRDWAWRATGGGLAAKSRTVRPSAHRIAQDKLVLAHRRIGKTREARVARAALEGGGSTRTAGFGERVLEALFGRNVTKSATLLVVIAEYEIPPCKTAICHNCQSARRLHPLGNLHGYAKSVAALCVNAHNGHRITPT